MASTKPKELVISFDDVPEYHLTDKDLVAVYSIDTQSGYEPHSRDWIGVFKEGWSHTRQYLAFEWAPKQAQVPYPPSMRSVLFPSQDIQFPSDSSMKYQLVYVNKQDDVVGMSNKFFFIDKPMSSMGSDHSLESLLGPNSSPTGSKQGLLDGYELVSNPSSTISDLVYLDYVNAVNSLEQIANIEDVAAQLQDAINTDQDMDCKENMERALVHVRSKDRALIKVNSKDKALVPYRKDKLMPIYTAKRAEDNSEKKSSVFDMTPVSTRYFLPASSTESQDKIVHDRVQELIEEHTPPTTAESRNVQQQQQHFGTVKQVTMAKCRRCRRQRSSLDKLKKRYWRTVTELDNVADQRDAANQDREIKEAQVEELSKQIDELMAENTSMTATNDTLMCQLKAASSTKQQHKARLAALQHKLDVLREGMEKAEEEKNQLQAKLEEAGSDREQMLLQKEKLELTVAELEHQNNELNHQLDDILYTLSLQGLTRYKDKEGKVIDLSKVAGSLTAIDGWNVATSSRKTGRLLAGLANKDIEIQSLGEECQHLKQNATHQDKKLQEVQTQLQSEKATVEVLQKNLVQVDGQLYDLQQHVIVLADLLAKAGQEKTIEAEKSKEREEAMEQKMARLTQQINAAEEQQKNKLSACTHCHVLNLSIPPSTSLSSTTEAADSGAACAAGSTGAAPTAAPIAAPVIAETGISANQVTSTAPVLSAADTTQEQADVCQASKNRVLDDPAIITAVWRDNKQSIQPSASNTKGSDIMQQQPAAPMPDEAFFVSNPTVSSTTGSADSNDTSCDMPKAKKMKRSNKKAKKLTYYPTYKPMKALPGHAVAVNNTTTAAAPKPREAILPAPPPPVLQDFKLSSTSITTPTTTTAPTSSTAHIGEKRKLSPSTEPEVTNNTCSRCGMEFPKNCHPERVRRHKEMHRRNRC